MFLVRQFIQSIENAIALVMIPKHPGRGISMTLPRLARMNTKGPNTPYCSMHMSKSTNPALIGVPICVCFAYIMQNGLHFRKWGPFGVLITAIFHESRVYVAAVTIGLRLS